MLATDRNDLVVRRVIAGLELERDFRVYRLEIMFESCLLGPRSENQNFVAGFDGFCDGLEKCGVLLDVTRSDCIGMMVDRGGGKMRVHYARADTCKADREDFRRNVIDPDHSPPVKLTCMRRRYHRNPLYPC